MGEPPYVPATCEGLLRVGTGLGSPIHVEKRYTLNTVESTLRYHHKVTAELTPYKSGLEKNEGYSPDGLMSA